MTEEAVKSVEKNDGVQAAQPERVYLPRVDIMGNANETVLEVDMPGVDEKSVDVDLENNTLTISGRVSRQAPAGHSPAREEVDVTTYRREFELLHEVDREKIAARMKDGVLRLKLYRAEKAKAKKIQIQAN
ncbi:MAG: heat-shock protein Hsp20 [Verrucomicrobia bacterium]|nr:heat-shock protein Hsp20 [Verrucomicrobiota bacterium]